MTDEEFEKWLGDVAFTALLSDESGYRPYVDASDVRALFAQLRAEQRWIPVEERLPETSGEYDVVRGDDNCRWRTRLFFMTDKKEWILQSWQRSPANVLFWFPRQEIPEMPPLPGAEGGE